MSGQSVNVHIEAAMVCGRLSPKSQRPTASRTKVSTLLDQIENSILAKDEVTLWNLGGAGFAIRTWNQLVYIDPYLVEPKSGMGSHRAVPIPFAPEDITKADAVVSTHEHEDHCNERTLMAFSNNTKAVFLGPESSTRKVLDWGYEKNRVIPMKPGGTQYVAHQTRIRAFKSNDEYAKSALMYLVETPGGNIFHSGDSAYFGGFKKIGSSNKVDVALLNFGKQIPVEKPWYLSAREVALAAKDLQSENLIPMHWDLFTEIRADPRRIRKYVAKLCPGSRFLIVRQGEKFSLADGIPCKVS